MTRRQPTDPIGSAPWVTLDLGGAQFAGGKQRQKIRATTPVIGQALWPSGRDVSHESGSIRKLHADARTVYSPPPPPNQPETSTAHGLRGTGLLSKTWRLSTVICGDATAYLGIAQWPQPTHRCPPHRPRSAERVLQSDDPADSVNRHPGCDIAERRPAPSRGVARRR